MYDINDFKILLKQYRKSRGFSLEELGNKIGKTKATISKYEKGEVIPDVLTMIEICNALDICISQLFATRNLTDNTHYLNPFNTNKLYLYYYTENILITSIMELIDENHKILVRLFNGIKDNTVYAKSSSYFYEGILESSQTIGYINLSNSSNTQFEKLQISFNIPWSNNFEITNFFILGLTPNAIPILKKGIMSVIPITNFDPFKEDLKITADELNRIKRNNGWVLENKNYNHFFFDKKD